MVTHKFLDESSKYHGLFAEIRGQPVILINRHRTTAERTIALMEEMAHFETTSGNILDQSKVENRKAELHARAKVYKNLLPAIQKAIRDGLVFHWEIADAADIPHETLNEIIDYCQRKGICLSSE